MQDLLLIIFFFFKLFGGRLNTNHIKDNFSHLMKNYFPKLQCDLNKILKKIDTDLVDFFPIYGVKENVLCKYSIILNIDFSRVYGLQKSIS